jgi:hypothetical protein
MDTSVTTHCHAAAAALTREYQGDHRRTVLTPATSSAAHPHPPPANALTTYFHISECAARHERSNERGRGAAGSPDPDLVMAPCNELVIE